MAASAAAVELRRPPEFRADDDERLIEHPPLLQIDDERGECGIEIPDQLVLLENARVVSVPAGAVGEVQIVRDLDEADAFLHQPAGEQTPLAELAAVPFAQAGFFLGEIEGAGEPGT